MNTPIQRPSELFASGLLSDKSLNIVLLKQDRTVAAQSKSPDFDHAVASITNLKPVPSAYYAIMVNVNSAVTQAQFETLHDILSNECNWYLLDSMAVEGNTYSSLFPSGCCPHDIVELNLGGVVTKPTANVLEGKDSADIELLHKVVNELKDGGEVSDINELQHICQSFALRDTLLATAAHADADWLWYSLSRIPANTTETFTIKGVAQFMLGLETEAERSFMTALAGNPEYNLALLMQKAIRSQAPISLVTSAFTRVSSL